MEPRIDNASDSRPSIGCSEAYKLFEGRVSTDPDEMDWTKLRPISPSRRDTVNMQPRKYSALELDTAGEYQEAAVASDCTDTVWEPTAALEVAVPVTDVELDETERAESEPCKLFRSFRSLLSCVSAL